jgi:hypothetical protein
MAATIGPGAPIPKPKPAIKKPKVIDPFGVPHVGTQVLPGLAGAKPLGLSSPLGVTIPQADTIVKPNAPSAPQGDGGGLRNYTGEITSDPMYGIGQKNYQDALTMGESSLLRSPIAQLISTYGYDPRAYLAAHPESGLSQTSIDLANRYLDPAGLAAAQNDPATVANQIAKGFNQGLAAVPGTLAESGLERSGSSAIMGNKLTYDRALQDRSAMEQFLSGIGTANTNWLDYQNQQANTWRQAQEDIATRLSNDAGYHAMLNAQGGEQDTAPTAPTPAPPPAPMSPAMKKAVAKVKAQMPKPAGWAKAISGITGW